jgi:hypothetical protein
MVFLIFLIIVVIVIAVIRKYGLSFLIGGSETQEEKFPYIKKNYLLTKAEVSFFRVLEQAIENKYYIFVQVHLSELLYIKDAGQDFRKYRNKIDRKSIDFVIAEKNYLSPLLAIELDDNTHYLSERMDRDDFVEKACKAAGLPLLRVGNSYSYDVPKLKNRIEELISGKKEFKPTQIANQEKI